MRRAEPRAFAKSASAALCLVLVACASTPRAGITPAWQAAVATSPVPGVTGRGISVSCGPWADQRPGAPGRQLGSLRAAVFGLHGSELVLAVDPAPLMGQAVCERLRLAGYTVVPAGERADWRLDGALQAMSLNVAGRDDRRVALQARLGRQMGEPVVWSGLVEDREERFAGVSGNTQEDLEIFLGKGIAAVASRLGATVAEHAAAPRGATTAPAAVPAAPVGVTSMTAGVAPVSPAAAVGYVLVSTTPPRAKVYVDDVYHGLSPVTLELPPGVSQVHVKMDGYRAVAEKVAVRRGLTIELELRLERP